MFVSALRFIGGGGGGGLLAREGGGGGGGFFPELTVREVELPTEFAGEADRSATN